MGDDCGGRDDYSTELGADEVVGWGGGCFGSRLSLRRCGVGVIVLRDDRWQIIVVMCHREI